MRLRACGRKVISVPRSLHRSRVDLALQRTSHARELPRFDPTFGAPAFGDQSTKKRREAGLAGFEPATHGPGNRCSIPPPRCTRTAFSLQIIDISEGSTSAVGRDYRLPYSLRSQRGEHEQETRTRRRLHLQAQGWTLGGPVYGAYPRRNKDQVPLRQDT